MQSWVGQSAQFQDYGWMTEELSLIPVMGQ
jgi:hypothetical protein